MPETVVVTPLRRMATFNAVKKIVSKETKDAVNGAILGALCDFCEI